MKKNTGYLQVVLGSTSFAGDDPIRILDFVAQYVTQAEILYMTEREAYVTLPNFPGKRPAQQFSAGRVASNQSERISSWPSAINCLLRAYATDANIRRAVEDLRAVHQRNPCDNGVRAACRSTGPRTSKLTKSR